MDKDTCIDQSGILRVCREGASGHLPFLPGPFLLTSEALFPCLALQW